MDLKDPAIKNRILPALERMGEQLLRCVVPIFSNAGRVPIQRGCGLLVATASHHFIVTAAHVVRDEVKKGTLCISLGGKLLRGICGRHLLTTGPGQSPRADDVDTAVLMLEGKNLPPYPAIHKYPLSDSELLAGSARGTGQFNYFLAGYPGSKGGRGKNPLELSFHPYSYTNIEAPLAIYPKAKADPQKHFAVTFDQRRGIGPGGNIRAFPFPYGMSGSPLWLLSMALMPRVPVVGIATTWRKSEKVIVASDIGYAIEMISRLSETADRHP